MANPVSLKMLSKSSGVMTTNATGVASGVVQGVHGEILGIYVDLGTASSAAVTVTNDTASVMLNGVSVSSDTFYPVRRNAITNDGSTAITNSFIPYVNFGGNCAVAVASGGNAKTLSVSVYYR